jgi:hypothetical protein
MKYALFLFICVLGVGCSTTRRPSASSVLLQVDLVLARERDVHRFEGRLNELGAQIEKGARPEERVAIVALPGKPGYFPPRTLHVIYVITDNGSIELKRAEVTSLGARFARSMSVAKRRAGTRSPEHPLVRLSRDWST